MVQDLLSSIGESYSSLQPDVKKIPYSVEAAKKTFDITNRQPQLFVTPDFEHLNIVLNEFVCQMALHRGGLYGIQKAIESKNIATVEYSSGLQVSGTFTEVFEKDGDPIFIRADGPSSLNFHCKQLEGHGKNYHEHGFSSPIGHLENQEKPLELFSDVELKTIGIEKGKDVKLNFKSGVQLKGNLQQILRKEGKILIMTFSECKVTYQNKTLFEPNWGIYDMAVGEKIYSAFSRTGRPRFI